MVVLWTAWSYSLPTCSYRMPSRPLPLLLAPPRGHLCFVLPLHGQEELPPSLPPPPRRGWLHLPRPPPPRSPRRLREVTAYSFLGMGHANVEKNMFKPRDEDPLLDSDDERPESFDDELRRKEMRRGINLATTLERIGKNFVITDPRLVDNPIDICIR